LHYIFEFRVYVPAVYFTHACMIVLFVFFGSSWSWLIGRIALF